MPGISTLADNFDDNTLDTGLWPGTYGTTQEAGGRARVACDTGFSAYKSATAYSLTGSRVVLQMYPPAANGASSATCSALVVSNVPGTDAGFLVDSVFTVMGCYLRTGGGDASPVFLTFSAVDHAWLRLREAAGTLYWETSPDGTTWTAQRTAATPAWAADTDLALLLESHRDTGAANFAEYDNVGLPPGQTVVLTPAVESSAPPTPGRTKTAATTPALESVAAPAPAGRKTAALTAAAETGTAPTPAGRKGLALQPASETAADTPAAGPRKSMLLLAAVETATATTAAGAKSAHLTPALETDTAPAAARFTTAQNITATAILADRWTATLAPDRWTARDAEPRWAATGP